MNSMRTRPFWLGWVAWLALLLAASPLLALPPVVDAGGAAPFVVNTTEDPADDGVCSAVVVGAFECSLREAINLANTSAGADEIRFDIGGVGPHTIALTSELPEIIERVTIDGYSQDGAAENSNATGAINATLQIVLDGIDDSFDGLTFEPGAERSVVKGLVIQNFGDGIRIDAKEVRVEGNFIGTDSTGLTPAPNSTGVFASADSIVVGGGNPAQRNLLSGNSFNGLLISIDVTGVVVQGNLIGTDKSAVGNLGNLRGVLLADGAARCLLGGQTATAANVVAFNVEVGIRFNDGAGNGNRILRNSIFNNLGLGIDLDDDGVTDNDTKDPDAGSNRLQNFPVLTLAESSFVGDTTIKGKLNSTPNSDFLIQVFGSPSGQTGQGKTFLGQKKVTTNTKGNATFTLAGDLDAIVGDNITATATNKKKGDTSEFSAVLTVVLAT